MQGADQRKQQSSASPAFVRGIRRWPVNSPHKGPVTGKMFPLDDVIMKPRWGVPYVPCVTNLRAIYAWGIQWHVTGTLSLAEHWHGRCALSNHVSAHSVISMWDVIFLQHLARACSEQSRSTAVLPMNHVIQMPQCLSGLDGRTDRTILSAAWL